MSTVTILKTERLFPHVKPSLNKIPLSILDNTELGNIITLTFFYEDAARDIDLIKKSLEHTLSVHPRQSGHLRRSEYVKNGDHTQRYGRLYVEFGTETDPGVEVIEARCDQDLHSVFPSNKEKYKNFMTEPLPFKKEFSSKILLKLHGDDDDGAPVMSVQLTHFKCGGLGLNVRFLHCLCDARSFADILHDWASVCRAFVQECVIRFYLFYFHKKK